MDELTRVLSLLKVSNKSSAEAFDAIDDNISDNLNVQEDDADDFQSILVSVLEDAEGSATVHLDSDDDVDEKDVKVIEAPKRPPISKSQALQMLNSMIDNFVYEQEWDSAEAHAKALQRMVSDLEELSSIKAKQTSILDYFKN